MGGGDGWKDEQELLNLLKKLFHCYLFLGGRATIIMVCANFSYIPAGAAAAAASDVVPFVVAVEGAAMMILILLLVRSVGRCH